MENLSKSEVNINLMRENGLLEIELSTLRPVLQTIVRAFSAFIVPYYCVSIIVP